MTIIFFPFHAVEEIFFFLFSFLENFSWIKINFQFLPLASMILDITIAHNNWLRHQIHTRHVLIYVSTRKTIVFNCFLSERERKSEENFLHSSWAEWKLRQKLWKCEPWMAKRGNSTWAGEEELTKFYFICLCWGIQFFFKK